MVSKNKELLLEIDYFGQTGYHWAAKRGYLPILYFLITSGRHINLSDKKRRTPLFLAAKGNCLEACEMLINSGANPYLQDINDKRPIDMTDNVLIKRLLFEKMDVYYIYIVVIS